MGSFLLCVSRHPLGTLHIPALLGPVLRGTKGNKKRPPRQFCREDVYRRDTTSLRFHLAVKASAGTPVSHRKDKVDIFAKPGYTVALSRARPSPPTSDQTVSGRCSRNVFISSSAFASHHPAYLWKRSMRLLLSGHGIYVVHNTTRIYLCPAGRQFSWVQTSLTCLIFCNFHGIMRSFRSHNIKSI